MTSNPNPLLLPPKATKSNTRSQAFSCKNTLLDQNKTTHLTRDHNYKLLWKKELQTVYPSHFSSLEKEIEDDAEIFQELVDSRCVDNFRMLVVDSVQEARAGHPGMAMGMAEVGYLLYRHVLRYNPRDPGWFDRDRFVLSAGHGCLLQYVCLHLAGFQSVQVLISLVLSVSFFKLYGCT